MLPTFIIIGAMKCGTTSMYRHLDAHPEVWMSKKKELDFFIAEKNYPRGVDWYASHFACEGAKAYGEASPNYTKYPEIAGVPERMHRLLPDVKLIYMLRDPVERTASHYAHNYIKGAATDPVETLTPFEGNHYVESSMYGLQLSRYLAYYPLERIRVITLEELRQKPQETLQATFRFIGVDDGFLPADPSEVHHQTSSKAMRVALRQRVANPWLRRVLRWLPSRMLRRWLPSEPPPLSEALQGQLRTYLADDVQRLRALTGRDFAEWDV